MVFCIDLDSAMMIPAGSDHTSEALSRKEEEITEEMIIEENCRSRRHRDCWEDEIEEEELDL